MDRGESRGVFISCILLQNVWAVAKGFAMETVYFNNQWEWDLSAFVQ